MAAKDRPDPGEIPDLEVGPTILPKKGLQKQARPLVEIELEGVGSVTSPVGDLATDYLATSTSDAFDALALEAGRKIDVELTDRAVSANATSDRMSWPKLDSADTSRVQVPEDEVDRCVPWGKPPTHLFETLAYAFWVYRGQRDLSRRIRGQEATVAIRLRARNDVSCRVFDAMRARLVDDPRFEKDLKPLLAIEAQYQSTATDYNQARDQITADLKQVADRRSEIEGQLAEAQIGIVAQTAERENLSQNLAREQAKRRRIDIDARSGLLSAAEHANLCSDQDTTIENLSGRLVSTNEAMTRQTQEQQRLLLQVRGIEDEQKVLVRREKLKQDAVQVGMLSVLDAAEKAKLQMLRHVIALREERLLDAVTRERLVELDTALDQALFELAVMVKAYSRFDKLRVRQGIRLLFLCIALVLSPLVLRCFS